ncbi:MAG TPA: LON peptidase substrate-binding domain-containing protein [Rhodanobacteraceae bacterium]|nr:LON peptidase substrate-binding domain-containing protein [Rhodanobacteraceae bacterium]
MTREDIPLFPLGTVLFPGGPLGLRVFEQRYLQMVRDCTRDQSCFGICLILKGAETGAPALPAAVGTLARITDFYSQSDGLLGISVEGGARFRVLRTRVRDNGLVRGDVRYWPDEPTMPVPPEFGLLADILERLVERAGGWWRDAPRERYDDASWVGFRLAEFLPLRPTERQQLLELADPLERLRVLRDVLPRFQKE